MELWGKQWKPVNLDRPPSALEKGQQEWSGGQWEETWQVKPRAMVLSPRDLCTPTRSRSRLSILALSKQVSQLVQPQDNVTLPSTLQSFSFGFENLKIC